MTKRRKPPALLSVKALRRLAHLTGLDRPDVYGDKLFLRTKKTTKERKTP